MEDFTFQPFCSGVEGKCFSVKGTNRTSQKPQEDKPSQSLLFLKAQTLLHFPVVKPQTLHTLDYDERFSSIKSRSTSPLTISYNCCSGNFPSQSLGQHLCYPGSFCGSSYPSNQFCNTNLRSPSTCQLGSSLSNGCQETCCEPTSCPMSYPVSKPCQMSCYPLRTSTLFSPCQTNYTGSLGFGSNGFQSLGCGSPSLGFGLGAFQSVGYSPSAFSSLGCRSSFYRPLYSSRSCQSAFYQPTCGSGFYESYV
ncbi:keratin-associated protein 13-1-like [Mirounga angustirostris]|uniref:keratin-associated protein 13-1-like n=1 Tax=Mirounga angustirostris TaxID=9716 RepID=UPI00313B0703